MDLLDVRPLLSRYAPFHLGPLCVASPLVPRRRRLNQYLFIETSSDQTTKVDTYLGEDFAMCFDDCNAFVP